MGLSIGSLSLRDWTRKHHDKEHIDTRPWV